MAHCWRASTLPNTGCAAVSIAASSTPGCACCFKTASRLGDGVIWYALMLALPFIYGAQGLKVALIMLATSAVGLAVYKFLKRTFVRERPFIRHAGISLARRAARSLQLPVGPHAARGGLHLAGLRGVSRTQLRAGAAGAGHRRVARGARPALSDRRAGRRLVRRGQRRDRRVASVDHSACGYCSSPTSTFRASTASPLRSALSRRPRARSASRPCWSRRNIPAPRRTPSPASSACLRAACRAIPEDRRFLGGPLKRALNAELAAQRRPGAHPHAVHRALRRACVSRASTACRWSRPITPSSKTICITTCRSCRAASDAGSRGTSRSRNAPTSPR